RCASSVWEAHLGGHGVTVKRKRQSLPRSVATRRRLPGNNSGSRETPSGLYDDGKPDRLAFEGKYDLESLLRLESLHHVVFTPDHRGHGEHAMVRNGGHF